MDTSNGFSQHQGIAVPLDQANVDTDQIIPKQFLTSVSRKGFGKHLFHDWRYLDAKEQQLNPDFIMNQPQFTDASILLARENFGCGSSREHAPWAIQDYGFKVIIATSFADIFYGNCINNQLLPVALSSEQMDVLFNEVKQSASAIISVDLTSQTVCVNQHRFTFDIAPHHKNNLLKGLDAIGQTLELAQKITDYEDKQPQWLNNYCN